MHRLLGNKINEHTWSEWMDGWMDGKANRKASLFKTSWEN